jgi:penicillin-insensitive murein endopeptidase
MTLTLVLSLLAASPELEHGGEIRYCEDRPREGRSLSLRRASAGEVIGAMKLAANPFAMLMPRRHQHRCLDWATPRLVQALMRAGAFVRRQSGEAPPLAVGNLSRAGGGPIYPYSRSHQSGRDADLAPYQLGPDGRSLEPEDLITFGPDLRAAGDRRFDTARNWALVEALLSDPSIDVKWLFISAPLRLALLKQGQARGANEVLLSRATRVLHQPSDAPPHADHLHLRIRCTKEERALGCVD